PSISGMDPPFGDAFQNYSFADQALTSTDLLASSSDPDFMYELDRDMTCRQSPRGNIMSVGDCKEMEGMDHFTEVDNDPTCNSNFEHWDTYWEDLTKYTKLTNCDIWGTKEVDFLGLDDFSSPYQDEEVIGKTPTLAQLNSEDSQPVCDTLYHPDLILGQKPHTLTPSINRKKASCRLAASSSTMGRNPLPDYAEGVQKATRPVPSSTETISKAQAQNPKVMSLTSDSKDYVRKAKVRINAAPRRPMMDAAPAQANLTIDSSFAENRNTPVPTTNAATATTTAAAAAATAAAAAATTASPTPSAAATAVASAVEDKKLEKPRVEVAPVLEFSAPAVVSRELFPAAGGNLEEEDHDEGFGSEHELSENEEEEEEEEDYEDDKDDDMSDTFSEQGCDNDAVEDMKGVTAGFSRKRGKRRYFWEYSEQLTPSKQERMLKPSEWDRDTLPSNMYQRNGLHHGKYTVKKSRRTDVEDLTPNPRKLLQIGNELRKLNKVISDLTPVSELPLTARPRSRKEKNKLASRACRLKKKAQYEANKVKLWGLNTEYDRILFVINAIKEEIVSRVQNLRGDKGTKMVEKLDQLIKETLVRSPVASQTSEFVNQILENTARGDPTGGLVGLRVPTSKV
ncbi:CRERF factor, partial [Amia calva]|nr:CRERF factor [Amia calva]